MRRAPPDIPGAVTLAAVDAPGRMRDACGRGLVEWQRGRCVRSRHQRHSSVSSQVTSTVPCVGGASCGAASMVPIPRDGMKAQRHEHGMQGAIAGPAGAPGPVGEPGFEEIRGVISGQRTRVVIVEMDELAYIIERHFPAPRRIERLQPIEGRRWTIGQTQLRSAPLKQVNREFFGFARHRDPPTHPEKVANAGGVQSTYTPQNGRRD